MAFYAMGIPLGSLLGMVIGGQLADTVGWRNAFLIVGLPGLMVVALVLALVRDTGRVAHAQPSQGKESAGQTLLILIRSPTFVMLLAAASTSSFLSYGKGTWSAIFFQRTHGLSPGEVGFWFGLWGGLAGVAGTWLGGQIANRFGRNHLTTAPAIGMALAIPLALAGYNASDWRLSMLLLMLPTLLNSLYYGPVYSSTQGLVAPRQRAMASALLLFCQNLIGLGLGPLFFGMLSDWLKPTYGADSVRYVLYGAALLGLVPALLYWLLRPRLAAEVEAY
jgi:predicted MFS family arabinose efflux permease